MHIHYVWVIFQKILQLITRKELEYMDMCNIFHLIIMVLMLMIFWIFINILRKE